MTLVNNSPHERTRSRRERILTILREQEYISVRDLSDEFGVTEMSVRRDLHAMELEGSVFRVRGGATRPRVTIVSKLTLGVHKETLLKSNEFQKLRAN
jgi:DeoR/GlpR family transcriptional regulator of sugar metabolism